MPDSVPRMTVEVFPAAQGDALLVRCFTDGSTTNILIDAGLAETYRTHLRPRLQELKALGQRLSAFIVTHIDSDHIEGAIAFLMDNGDAANPAIIPIDDVWHNSYRHLDLLGRPPTAEEINSVLAQTSLPTPPTDANISARQGSTLAALLNRHNYPWNRAFAGGPIVVSTSPTSIKINEGVRLTLLSPGSSNLQALARRWRQELLRMGVPYEAVSGTDLEAAFEARLLRSLDDDNPAERTAISGAAMTDPPPASSFREDRSVTNGSSIAVHIHAGPLSALFLGDAFPSVVSKHLQHLRSDGEPQRFGIVKVSHHGSKRNTSPDLLSHLQADHFVVSTSGALHAHPDIETLLWIASTQKGACLHFNYPTPRAKAISSLGLREKFGHSVHIGEENSVLRLEISGA